MVHILKRFKRSQERTVDIGNYMYIFCKGLGIVFGLFLCLIVAVCIDYDVAVSAATCGFSVGLWESGLYFWNERSFLWSWVHCFLTGWLVKIIQLKELYFDFIYLHELIVSCYVYFHKVYALTIWPFIHILLMFYLKENILDYWGMYLLLELPECDFGYEA